MLPLDTLVLYAPQNTNRAMAKLTPKWLGPAKVTVLDGERLQDLLAKFYSFVIA